jgi:hypothetical protein
MSRRRSTGIPSGAKGRAREISIRGPDYETVASKAAPWREVVGQRPDGTAELGPEYLPRSCRTGRPVAYATAMADYLEAHGAIGSPGLWDHDKAPAGVPCRRYDYGEIMRALERHPMRFSGRMRDVVEWFFERQHSERVTAIELGISEGRVHQLIADVRRVVRILM